MEDYIFNYINNQTRNKIIVLKNNFLELDFVDVGLVLSKCLHDFTSDEKIAVKTHLFLEEKLDYSIKVHSKYGKYLAIKNLGILFEKELKLNFCSILDKYSRSNLLFIKWEGEIDEENLYFLSKIKGEKINIKNLSYIAI